MAVIGADKVAWCKVLDKAVESHLSRVFQERKVKLGMSANGEVSDVGSCKNKVCI